MAVVSFEEAERNADPTFKGNVAHVAEFDTAESDASLRDDLNYLLNEAKEIVDDETFVYSLIYAKLRIARDFQTCRSLAGFDQDDNEPIIVDEDSDIVDADGDIELNGDEDRHLDLRTIREMQVIIDTWCEQVDEAMRLRVN